MTLEELLREAAAKGLTHLTLYPVPSEDHKKLYWTARATPSTGHSYISTTTLDPAEAVAEVLKGLPKAPKRVAKITAAVTDEELREDLQGFINTPKRKADDPDWFKA